MQCNGIRVVDSAPDILRRTANDQLLNSEEHPEEHTYPEHPEELMSDGMRQRKAALWMVECMTQGLVKK